MRGPRSTRMRQSSRNLYEDESDEPIQDADVEIAEQETERSAKITKNATSQEKRQILQNLFREEPELQELYHTTLDRIGKELDDYSDIFDIYKYEKTKGNIDVESTVWTADESAFADELMKPLNARTRHYELTGYESTLDEFNIKILQDRLKDQSEKMAVSVNDACIFLEGYIKETMFGPANLLGWNPLKVETVKRKARYKSGTSTSFNNRWGLLKSGIVVDYEIVDEEYQITVKATKFDFPGQIEYLCGRLGRDFLTFNELYERVFSKALTRILKLYQL